MQGSCFLGLLFAIEGQNGKAGGVCDDKEKLLVLALLCASEAQKGVSFFICKIGLITWLS